MADFLISYKTVRANEGGYRNVSWDAGGETYKGIARKFWPNWLGWKIVDAYKQNHTLKTGDYIPDTKLDALVHEFFKVNFWDKNRLGSLTNQSLATLALDMSINHGRGPKIINESVSKIKQITISSVVTTDSVAVMNKYPEQAYKLIADARVKYVESLKDQLGPDYKAVLARAKSFLTKYKTGIVAGAGLLITSLLFFF